MSLDAATIARIATESGTDAADVAAFLPVYIETAVRLIAAGEITLDDLATEPGAQAMVARVASDRIRRVLEQETETILGRVWDAVNAEGEGEADLPMYPGENPAEFVEVDAEGFAVYRREPVAPGTYRREDGGTIIVCAADGDDR